jgi:glycogen(starch) synthase
MQCDVIIVGSFPPPNGGQAIHIENLSRYLGGSGLAVVTLNTGVNKRVQVHGVRNVASSLELLKALLFDYRAKLVHVHVGNPNEFGKLLPVGVASIIMRSKCVLTIHSGNVETFLRQVSAWRKYIIGLIFRCTDKVICVNETTRKYISSWAACSKLRTIPAYSIHFSERQPDEQMGAFLRTHDPLISCVGFFEPIYGFDLAILAAKRLMLLYPKIGFVIMGDAKDSSKYATMIRDHNVSGNVLLCGNIHHDICLSVIKQSTLFLRPTLYDGDSISVREALALGTRVLASDTEFRPPGVTTFAKGDFMDMTTKIDALLRSPGGPVKGVLSDASNLEAVKKVYLEVLD